MVRDLCLGVYFIFFIHVRWTDPLLRFFISPKCAIERKEIFWCLLGEMNLHSISELKNISSFVFAIHHHRIIRLWIKQRVFCSFSSCYQQLIAVDWNNDVCSFEFQNKFECVPGYNFRNLITVLIQGRWLSATSPWKNYVIIPPWFFNQALPVR